MATPLALHCRSAGGSASERTYKRALKEINADVTA